MSERIDVTSILLWVVAAGWFVASVRGVRDALAVRALPPLDSRAPVPRSVSVVIAARDEATRIETTVRRILAQEHVDLELVVVDDRSSDATPSILARIASEGPHLRTLRVDLLPDDWLGKPHACELGARSAHGDWILFTDADVWLAPDVIVRAIDAAAREAADHVVLTPRFAHASFLGQAGLGAFLAGFSQYTARVNRDDPRGYLGVGAFNLVRASAWRTVGGHVPLRMEIVDDMKLGLLLTRAGFRTRAFFTVGEEVQAQWASDLRGIVRALEKNVFAHFGYDTVLTLGIATALTAAWIASLTGPWTNTFAGWAAFAGLCSLAIPALVLAARSRGAFLPALLMPFAAMILVVAMLNSTIVTLRRGGVRWRGTFYPLAKLREGRVR